MKIKELEYVPLSEGFIDNLIDKVKTMAGGDGITGIVRSLSGQGAALNKLADQIERQTEAPLIRAMGNAADEARRSRDDMILTPVIQLGLTAATQFSSQDGDPVTGNEIIELLKTKKDYVQSASHSAHAGPVIDAILKYAATKDAGTVSGLGFDASVKEVSLVLAGAIVLVQLNKLLEEPAEPTQLDPAELQKFKMFGDKINETLFDSTSAVFRALKPNKEIVNNLHWLVIEMTKKVQQEFGILPADKLEAMAATPPVLVQPVALKQALGAHDPSVDPETVNRIVEAVTPIIQEQVKSWFILAAAEAKAGKGTEASQVAFGDWAKSAMGLIDRMQFGNPTQKQKSKPAGAETATDAILKAGDVEFNKAYQAALTAGKSEREAILAGEEAHAAYVNKELPPE